MLTGAILASLLFFASSAAAYCMGYCSEMEGYSYAGCSLHYDQNGHVDVAICAYIEDKGGHEELAQ
jgi:hypothetical protein